jgi:hypothetical protein
VLSKKQYLHVIFNFIFFQYCLPLQQHCFVTFELFARLPSSISISAVKNSISISILQTTQNKQTNKPQPLSYHLYDHHHETTTIVATVYDP